MKISIIVPVYNVEKYLQRCINSILSQTMSDFELILIDDGSQDRSGSICDYYAEKDKRIVVIHSQNKGVSSARNLGIDIAHGTYITFIDSDDWVDNFYLEQLYEKMRTFNCDIVVCGGKEIDECDKELRILDFKEQIKLSNIDPILYDFPYFTYVIHRLMIKRECLTKIRFDTTLSNGEDVLFLTQIFLNSLNGVLFIPYCGYYYLIRKDGASIHYGYNKKKFTAIFAYEKRLQIMEKSNLSMQKEWYESFLLQIYLLYGYIIQNKKYYSKIHADILFKYLHKYKKYYKVLGKGIKFKVRFVIMLSCQKYLEKVLEKSKLSYGYIIQEGK